MCKVSFPAPVSPMIWRRHSWRWLALLGASLGLALLLEEAAFPAALLLGPMLCAIGFGVAGSDLRLPRWAFVGAQAVIGCLVARALTASILISIADDWAVMLLIVSTTVVAGALVGWVLVKFGALPGTTAAWGSSPGAALGDGGDGRGIRGPIPGLSASCNIFAWLSW